MRVVIIPMMVLVVSIVFSQQKKESLPSIFSTENKSVTIFTSADSTSLKLSRTNSNLKFKAFNQPLETDICIFVNPNKQFQTFLGIGGAITDASAEVFAKLSKEKQEEFLNAYFSSDKGIGYSVIRTNMNSCDFSSKSYAYITEGDKDLQSFSIAIDKKYRLPLLKKAMEIIGKRASLYISPWSPPAFMKDNNNVLQGGKLLPEYYQSWANYYVKYINELQKEGITVWGLTIQNEPMAKQRWESCIYTAEEERDFLKNFLGPTLKKAGLGNKKIIIWDHNRDLITQRVTTILDDPEANKYVWGIGFHWYETWTGGLPKFENVGAVKEMYPNKNLLFTEGCNEKFDSKKYQLWANGERYGKSMINDFNNGTVGWTDWNILLDQNGGPNHVQNFCFSPIHADLSKDELIYTPSYYFIGHFSKFIQKGAKRISSLASRSILLTTSFLNPDGKIVTIVINQENKKVKYYLSIGMVATEIEIQPHAIQTLVY
ncbi:glycoside hydrolase family 30 protein [Flavobacterium luteum]|uniref:Glycosyl hydrolase n=1 Tax=Flavobacterium luteum TaxID=2026654 RepID=A0A7J5AB80_9FLAO|nr:glycoside hydrolase family 30 protein [Flavobacterium luteum]KAB1154841.1 glycosyl hydrolase [Flavobacterium luteum]